ADAVTLVEEAQAGVDHVLADEVRRPGDGEEVLGEAALRAAERADLTRGPRLAREPFDRVVTVLLLTPADGPVADPRPFGQVRAAEVLRRDDVAGRRQPRVALARRRPAQVGVALLVQHRPGPLPGREVEVHRQLRAVAHRHHHVL